MSFVWLRGGKWPPLSLEELKAETVFYHAKGDRQKHLGLLNEMMIDTDDRYKLKYEIEMGIGQWPMAIGW